MGQFVSELQSILSTVRQGSQSLFWQLEKLKISKSQKKSLNHSPLGSEQAPHQTLVKQGGGRAQPLKE